MRTIMLAMALCTAVALPASANVARCGKITGVDDASKSFDCHWKKKDLTFKATEKTVVRAGKKAGAWSDMKAGQAARVEFHQAGIERIVDRIIITGLSF